MEKVTLTQEQLDAIERYPNKDDLMKAKLVGLLEHGKDEPIAELTVEELAKALYTKDYVVIRFDIGNWVTMKNSGEIGIVTEIEFEGSKLVVKNSEKVFGGSIESFRHATKEEVERAREEDAFHKRGRKPWKLRRGDILVKRDKNPCYYKSWIFVEETDTEDNPKERLIVRKAEHMRQFEESIDYIKEYYKVMYFVEDRSDI